MRGVEDKADRSAESERTTLMAPVNKYTTARVLAMQVKEFARIAYRDKIQHAKDQRPIDFMKADIRGLANGIQEKVLDEFSPEEVPDQLLNYVEKEYDLDEIGNQVLEYKGLFPQKLIARDLQRSSDMPTRLVAVMGSTGRVGTEMFNQCREFGRKLAEHGIVPVVTETNGVMEPVLEGVRSANGLSIGILAERDIQIKDGTIRDSSGLISLPVVHSDSEQTIRSTIAAMSGRAVVIINSDDPLTMRVRAAMTAAYGAIPTFLVNTNLPNVAQHPLQVKTSLDRLFRNLSVYIDTTPPEDGNNFDYLREDMKHPVSIFAGTKYDEYQASPEYTAEVAKLLSENGFFTVTGAGPGAMETIARAAQPKSLTLGLNFFPTYLSSNAFVDVPIVSNLKMERSDMMNLSSIAAVNLGGAHATFDEMASARRMGRPIINCVPRSFPSAFFSDITSYRADAPIFQEEDPQKILQRLKDAAGM